MAEGFLFVLGVILALLTILILILIGVFGLSKTLMKGIVIGIKRAIKWIKEVK